ncbi:MAG: AEC family transporter [Clostridia bacterium]|nr:AEC family transporter [Clostridia bacterium]
MIENFLTVAAQVLSLFIMITVGFILGKTKLLREEATPSISNLILYVATPAAILQAFLNEERTIDKTVNLALVAVFAVVTHLIGILIASLLIKTKNADTTKVLRFGVVFSNCGYMSFPLQKALLGDIGVFYGAMYVAVFNLVMWSYGIALMGRDKKLSLKKVIFNPAVIAVIISVVLYLLQLKLPSVLSGAVSALSTLNTPLPMIIIGYYLSTSNLLGAVTDKRVYLTAFLRLIGIPAIMLALLLLLGVHGAPLIACTVAASAPIAAAGTMFSIKFGRDTMCSVNGVTLTTLLSIITMPLFVAVAQLF